MGGQRSEQHGRGQNGEQGLVVTSVRKLEIMAILPMTFSPDNDRGASVPEDSP